MKFKGDIHKNVEGFTLTEGPKRGKHYVQPRGYVAMPGTGPEGETCKTCRHLCRKQMSKVYLKCGLNSARWTGGRGSDVLSRSPACKLWEKNDDRKS